MTFDLSAVKNATLTLVTVAAVTACAAAPVSYYSLSNAQRQPSSDTKDATRTLVYLRAVRIPTLMQRPEIVTRSNDTNKVNVLDDTLWAGDINEEVAKQYARHLEQSMPGLVAFNAPVVPDAQPDVFYTIQVDQLDGERGGNVNLRMHWTAKYPDTNQTEQGSFQGTEETEDNSVDAYLQAMNVLIARSAKAMSSQLSAY